MSRDRTLARVQCRWALLGVFLAMLILVLPGQALADTMALSISPEATEEVTAQISFAASSAEGTYAVVAVNNPGVPCAPNPGADNGHTIIEPGILTHAEVGEYGGSANYSFPSSGAYTVCGWVTSPAEFGFPGGPVTASTSLPLSVRLPAISLALRFPRPVHVNKRFTLELVATSEVKREVVVEGVPYTKRGCPVNYAATEEAHIIDTEVNGGPSTTAVNVNPLRAGKYRFCAWADPYKDEGLDPEATTSLILDLTSQATAKTHGAAKHKARKRRRRRKHTRAHHHPHRRDGGVR